MKRYRGKLHESDRARSIVGLTRTFQAQRPALAPFIGRTKEFAELQQRLNAAIAGECQFVVVAGEAGIGKTRLLDELESLAKARKIRVLRGRSAEQAGAFPYQGFCELIQEHFRLKEAESAPARDFQDLAVDLVSLFPILNEIGDIRQAATGDSKLAVTGSAPSPENRTEIFELLARALTRIGGGKPVVFFLEDLHAAEVSIEALQYIVRRLGPTPTLIIGSYRSTEVDHRHPLRRVLEGFRGDRRFFSIALGPLSPSEHRTLLETLVGGRELREGLVKRLYEGTEGNPFFTKELVRSLLDSGGIARDGTGAFSLAGDAAIAAEALPATIQQAVEARVERLPNDLRELLSVASVLGKTFDSRDLEKLAEGKEVEDALDRLVEDGYLEEERESRSDLLSFSSGVVRDVLYAGLPRRKRRLLHRKVAELVESRHGGRLERVLPQLVHHFYQGDVPEKTVEYGLRLAATSLDAFSAEEAARSAKIVLEFFDEEWEGDLSVAGEARMLLARAERMLGDIDGALKEAEAAVQVFEEVKAPARAVGALLLAAETAWQARRTEETGRWVERGLASARAAGETESLRQLLSLAATLANLLGDYEKANSYLAEAAGVGVETGGADEREETPKGGRLLVALANPSDAAEPATIQTVEEEETLANVFETLLATDAEGHLVPALCEKWAMADDGRSLKLTLREDVRFQDGHLLLAPDIKAVFENSIRELSRKLPSAFAAIRGWQEFVGGKADEVSGIVVDSDRELELILAEPLPIYPALLTHLRTGIARIVTDGGKVGRRVLGTGPFRIASHDRDRVLLERNPEYWKGTEPPLDEIEFRTSLTAAAIAKGFRAGEIDLARDLVPQDLEEILRDPRFRRGLVEVPKKSTYFVLFNCGHGPATRNTAVRHALSAIVRTRDLVWQTLGSFAQPAAGLIPPGMLGHDPGRKSSALTHAEALDVLRSAGIEADVDLKAAVHPLLRDRYGSLLAALLSTWSELGVKVEIVTSDMAAFLEAWEENAGLDLLIGRWNADYDDPDTFTHNLFHSTTGMLRSYFSSAESDAILEEARSESRPASRESLYRKFENLLLESAALLPLFHDIDYRLASPKVRGLKLRGTAPYVNYSELSKVESAEAELETRRAGGGIVHVPIAGVVSGLDPALADTLEKSEVIPSIFECLTRDAGGARMGPWLAAEMKIEKGGQTYRFRLREDVRFHDGRRLSARDVRYSFERLLQSRESENRWFYSPIRGARALLAGEAKDLEGFQIHSATELSIELEEPVAFFPALLAYSAAAIVPEGIDPAARPVGTGPFQVATFEPGERLELKRNRTYWRKGYPRSEGVIFTFGVSPKDALTGFRGGRFSLASDLFPEDVEALRREPEFASGYKETPQLTTYYAAFNAHRGPLADRGLRHRLIQAVDVPRLVRQTVGRLAIPAHGFIPPGLLGHDPGAAARADSGPKAKPGAASTPIELTAAVHPVFLGKYSALAREISTAFSEKEVKIRPVNQTMDEYLGAVGRGDVDLIVGRWNADYPDADTFVHVLHSQGLHGRFSSSAEIDRLVERGRAETAPAVRHSLYREIEEILGREALVLPLFHEQAYRFARPEVEGLSLYFASPIVAYESLHVRGAH